MTKNNITIPDIVGRKKSGRKIVALTAYDFTTARWLDASGVDIILVGDSLSMIALGYENTLPVTMDEMVHHTRAVARGVLNALVVGDMPFLSYQKSDEEAIENAGRFIKEAGAHAVKLEGGANMAIRVEALTRAGISVVGHLGLTPQSVHQMGGYKVQGKSYIGSRQIKSDAVKLQKAGAFALVLEGIPSDLAQEITQSLDIPTIGIGAGPGCDGQILVTEDMLGMNDQYLPRFVKQYAELGSAMKNAVQQYSKEVREGSFPDEKHSYASSKPAARNKTA